MKIHINYSEKWSQITDAIKEAEKYLKPLNVNITSEYIDFDASNEVFYENTSTWMKLVLKKIPSLKSSVIKALGVIKSPDADAWGLIVDKNKALEEWTLNGQAHKDTMTIEVYAKKRTSGGRYGLSYNGYIIVHEILHLMEFKYGFENNAIHTYIDSGEYRDFDAFVERIRMAQLADKPEENTSTWKYKYFSKDEPTGHFTDTVMGTCAMLKPELLEKLDKARGIAGVPFKITSGVRSAEYNAKIGGQPNSAHLRGYAADIYCKDNEARARIWLALVAVGFERFGIDKNYIHVDCDPSLPSPRVWHYY